MEHDRRSERTRFTAYSQELNSPFGFMFIALAVLWLRVQNVREKKDTDGRRDYYLQWRVSSKFVLHF